MPYLLKFEKNWADEFDVSGFTIVSEEEWEFFQLVCEYIHEPFEDYFGTNEGFTFDDGQDLLESITPEKLSVERAIQLKHLFGLSDVSGLSQKYNYFPLLDGFLDIAVEQDGFFENVKMKGFSEEFIEWSAPY